MRLIFNLIYTLLVIPTALGFVGQSCKTDDGYGVCMSMKDCMPTNWCNDEKCKAEENSVTPINQCSDGVNVCCVKTVKKFNGAIFPTPGRCLNKINCNANENILIKTKICPGKKAVMCLSKEVLKTIDLRRIISFKKFSKKSLNTGVNINNNNNAKRIYI